MHRSDHTAQEVVAMLREKLVVVSGDLVVAKSRVKELEINMLDDKISLKKSAETLLGSSRIFLHLDCFLFVVGLWYLADAVCIVEYRPTNVGDGCLPQ